MATRRRRRSTALVVSEDSGLLENLAQWLEDDGIGVLVCPAPGLLTPEGWREVPSGPGVLGPAGRGPRNRGTNGTLKLPPRTPT
jgi:hypothetical protein